MAIEPMALATELCVLVIYILKTIILNKLRKVDPFELWNTLMVSSNKNIY